MSDQHSNYSSGPSSNRRRTKGGGGSVSEGSSIVSNSSSKSNNNNNSNRHSSSSPSCYLSSVYEPPPSSPSPPPIHQKQQQTKPRRQQHQEEHYFNSSSSAVSHRKSFPFPSAVAPQSQSSSQSPSQYHQQQNRLPPPRMAFDGLIQNNNNASGGAARYYYNSNQNSHTEKYSSPLPYHPVHDYGHEHESQRPQRTREERDLRNRLLILAAMACMLCSYLINSSGADERYREHHVSPDMIIKKANSMPHSSLAARNDLQQEKDSTDSIRDVYNGDFQMTPKLDLEFPSRQHSLPTKNGSSLVKKKLISLPQTNQQPLPKKIVDTPIKEVASNAVVNTNSVLSQSKTAISSVATDQIKVEPATVIASPSGGDNDALNNQQKTPPMNAVSVSAASSMELEKTRSAAAVKNKDNNSRHSSSSPLLPHPPPPRNLKGKVAWVIALTECNLDDITSHYDGASILSHTIRSSTKSSQYSHTRLALLHTGAKECEDTFRVLGFEIKIVSTPIKSGKDFGGSAYLQRVIEKNGFLDYIKLHAWTLIAYDVVVLCDVTSMILKPLDHMLDIIHESNGSNVIDVKSLVEQKVIMDPSIPLPYLSSSALNSTAAQKEPVAITKVDALYTRDYVSIASARVSLNPNQKLVRFGIQDGLIVLRPSMETYNNMVHTMKTANFDKFKGWGELLYIGYLGSMLTKGFLAYYFDEVHNRNKVLDVVINTNTTVVNAVATNVTSVPVAKTATIKPTKHTSSHGTTLELNRCYFNSISDTPKTKSLSVANAPAINATRKGRDANMVCRDLRPTCEDCRSIPLSKIYSLNLRLCRNPWDCFLHSTMFTELKLCRDMMHSWFVTRKEVEEEQTKNLQQNGVGKIGLISNQNVKDNAIKEGGTSDDKLYNYEHFMGYCTHDGHEGYIPMQMLHAPLL